MCVDLYISPVSGNTDYLSTGDHLCMIRKTSFPKVSRARTAWVYMDLDPALPPWESPLPATTPAVRHPSDCPSYTASGYTPCTPNVCTLPRMTEVFRGDLSPRQPRWTNQGELAQIISSLNASHDIWLKGKAISLLLAPEPKTWTAVASPVISRSQDMKRSCS